MRNDRRTQTTTRASMANWIPDRDARECGFYLEKWDQADREFVACKIRKKLQGMGMNRYDKEDSDDD